MPIMRLRHAGRVIEPVDVTMAGSVAIGAPADSGRRERRRSGISYLVGKMIDINEERRMCPVRSSG